MTTGKYAQHQDLLKKTKLDSQQIFRNSIRLFERHVGLFFTKNGTPVNINKAGMSDMYGIILIFEKFPIHIEVEVKTGKSVLSKNQKIWFKFCELMRIKTFIVRDSQEFIKELKLYVDEVEKEMLSYCLQTNKEC